MKIKNIIKFILLIIMFFLGGIIFSLIFHYFGIDPTKFDSKDNAYFQCLAELTYAIIIYLAYRKYMQSDYKEFKNGKSKYMDTFVKYLAIFFAVKIASAVLTSIIGYMIGLELTDSENQTIIVELTRSAPFMMLLSTSLLAPIVEEGIFRLSLRKIINNKTVFIILSGLIFGFMHIFPTEIPIAEALTYSITYVTMGVFLAYVYADTDNIWIPILLHGTNNLLSMLAILFLG